eukprot:tig00020961_g16674.t1
MADLEDWKTVRSEDTKREPPATPSKRRERSHPEARIRFCIEYKTHIGQSVRVVGSDPKLGNWKLENGLRLQWKAGEWEDGENRRLVVDETCLDGDDEETAALPPTPGAPEPAAQASVEVPFVMELHDLWQSPNGQNAVQSESTTSDVLVGWKAPVVRALFAAGEGGAGRGRGPEKRRHAVVLFKATAWLKKTHCLAVIGNIPALGNWSSEKAVRLDDGDYPTWSLNIVSHDLKFEYKYIVLSTTDKSFVMWEDGPNRAVSVAPGSEMLAVVRNDGPFRRHGWGPDSFTAPIDPRAFKELGLRERLMGVASSGISLPPGGRLSPAAFAAAFAPASDQVAAPRAAGSRAALLRTLQLNILENGELRRRLRIVEEQNRRLVELMERRSQETLDAFAAGAPRPASGPGGAPAGPGGGAGDALGAWKQGPPGTPSTPQESRAADKGAGPGAPAPAAATPATPPARTARRWRRRGGGAGARAAGGGGALGAGADAAAVAAEPVLAQHGPRAVSPASHHQASPLPSSASKDPRPPRPPADPRRPSRALLLRGGQGSTGENTRFGLAAARRVLEEAREALAKADHSPDPAPAGTGVRGVQVAVRGLAGKLERQRAAGVHFLRDAFSDDVGAVADLAAEAEGLLRDAAAAEAALAAPAHAPSSPAASPLPLDASTGVALGVATS